MENRVTDILKESRLQKTLVILLELELELI